MFCFTSLRRPKARPSKDPMFLLQDSDHDRSLRKGTWKTMNSEFHATTRKIVAFHLDENSDWVAEFECGHEQRVYHTPLLAYRYWLTTPQGRVEYVGQPLNCPACLPLLPSRSRFSDYLSY
jgi:Protein of unknown function (DUF3565)